MNFSRFQVQVAFAKNWLGKALSKTEFGVEPGFWSGFFVLSRHGPVWRYSVRILKEVDLQRCQTVFREHTTSYHNTLSRTSSVLTPSPYPHSSLSLALRSFGFLRTSTPPGLVPSFTRAYGCTVSDYIRVSYTPTPFPCPHSSLSCALRCNDNRTSKQSLYSTFSENKSKTLRAQATSQAHREHRQAKYKQVAKYKQATAKKTQRVSSTIRSRSPSVIKIQGVYTKTLQRSSTSSKTWLLLERAG